MNSTTVAESSLTPAQAPTGQMAALIGCCALGAGCNAGFIAMPVLLAAIGAKFGFSDQQIGWLGSLELTGMLLGGLLAIWGAAKGRPRLTAATGAAAALLGSVGVLFAGGFWSYAALRVLGGLGAGLGNSMGFICIGYTVAVARNAGRMNAVVTLAGAIELMTLPWIVLHFGASAALLSLSLLALCALALLPLLPKGPALSAGRTTSASVPSVSRADCIMLLVAASVAQLAPAANWAYVDRIAALHGIPSMLSGSVLTAGTLLSSIFCFVSWRLVARIGSRWALASTIALMFFAVASWCLPFGGVTGFALRAITLFVGWVVSSVFQFTLISEVDSGGRYTSMMPAAQGLGMAGGPLLSAQLLGGGADMGGALAATAVLFLPPLVLLFLSRGGAQSAPP